MGVDHAVRPAQEDLSEVSSLEKELRSTEVEVGYASEEKRKYLQAGLSNDDADFLLSLTPKQQSAIYHKVDVRVVPMLACVMSFCLGYHLLIGLQIALPHRPLRSSQYWQCQD